jgi:hypothetical protein
VTFTTIILPEVLETAREYYNDPTLEGLPLEDKGGPGTAGSHWDKEFLTKELMNPNDEFPTVLSIFTIKLLEGTLWYKVSLATNSWKLIVLVRRGQLPDSVL